MSDKQERLHIVQRGRQYFESIAKFVDLGNGLERL